MTTNRDKILQYYSQPDPRMFHGVEQPADSHVNVLKAAGHDIVRDLSLIPGLLADVVTAPAVGAGKLSLLAAGKPDLAEDLRWLGFTTESMPAAEHIASSVVERPKLQTKLGEDSALALSILGDPTAITGVGVAPKAATTGARMARKGLLEADLEPTVRSLLDASNRAATGGLMDMPLDARIFAGRRAFTADGDQMRQAQQMTKEGAAREDVWGTTGWYKGKDDKWRFEIDDSKTSMLREDGGSRLLSDFMDHEGLYKAYPQLRETLTTIKILPDDAPEGMWKGSYLSGTPGDDKYFGLEPEIKVAAPKSEVKRILLHETQHAIQDIENFARGGSPEIFRQQAEAVRWRDIRNWRREIDKKHKQMPDADLSAVENAVVKDYQDADMMDWLPSRDIRNEATQPYWHDKETVDSIEKLIDFYGLNKRTESYTGRELYNRLAGEVEARNVANRRGLSIKERLMNEPWKADIPEDDQIVRFHSSLSESDYKGGHTAPEPDAHNSGHDFSDMFPDSPFDPNFARYYGTGMGEWMDQPSVDVMRRMAGNPDAKVTVYRAVPKGVEDINKGDWVTINRDYADFHGGSWLGEDYEIISKEVSAKEIFSEGNSIHEWGYHPNMPMDKVSRTTRARDQGYSEEVYYHGTNQDIRSFDPFKKGDYSSKDASGYVFLSDNPDLASQYADQGSIIRLPANKKKVDEIGGKIDEVRKEIDRIAKETLPPKARDRLKLSFEERERMLAPTEHGNLMRKWIDLQDEQDLYRGGTTGQGANVMPVRIKGKIKDIDVWGEDFSESKMKAYIKQAEEEGYDGLRLIGLSDDTHYRGLASEPQTTTVVFNPKNIRSVHAKFDPAKKKSSDILAATLPIGIGGLLSGQQEKRPYSLLGTH